MASLIVLCIGDHHDCSRQIAIRKINVFTEVALRGAEKLRENLNRRPARVGIAEIMNGVAEDLSRIASDLIVIFQSSGKA